MLEENLLLDEKKNKKTKQTKNRIIFRMFKGT